MSKYNLKDWKFSSWVKANKSNIRLVLAGLFGILAASISGWSSPYAVTLGAVTTAGSNWILDTLDY